MPTWGHEIALSPFGLNCHHCFLYSERYLFYSILQHFMDFSSAQFCLLRHFTVNLLECCSYTNSCQVNLDLVLDYANLFPFPQLSLFIGNLRLLFWLWPLYLQDTIPLINSQIPPELRQLRLCFRFLSDRSSPHHVLRIPLIFFQFYGYSIIFTLIWFIEPSLLLSTLTNSKYGPYLKRTVCFGVSPKNLLSWSCLKSSFSI